MSVWLQNLIVFLAVAGCLGYVGWQTTGTLFGRKGRIGSCCAKGCPTTPTGEKKQGGERIVFLPVEALGRKR